MGEKSTKILQESSRHRLGLFGDIMLRNPLFRPDREAFIYGNQRITFEQYNDRVNSLIHALWNMPMKKGDILGALSWNCVEYADVFGAAQKGGFIIAPFNVRLSTDELYYLISDSHASVLFVGPEVPEVANTLKPRLPQVKHFISFEASLSGMQCHADLLADYPSDEPQVEVNDDDPLYICYTSGTTGRPHLRVHPIHIERNPALESISSTSSGRGLMIFSLNISHQSTFFSSVTKIMGLFISEPIA